MIGKLKVSGKVKYPGWYDTSMLLIPIKSSYDIMIENQINDLLKNELNIFNNMHYWISQYEDHKKYGDMFIQLELNTD